MIGNMDIIGHVYVDAGIVMVGDPCYTLPDDATDRNEAAKDWVTFCNTINECDTTKGVQPFGDGLGIVVSSGYGDGCYPVYAEYEDDPLGPGRRVKRIMIEFIGDDE